MLSQIFGLLWVVCLAEGFPPTQVYSNFADLDPAGKFRMYWNTTGSRANDTITIELHVETKGWVGLGFSPNGAMSGADMVISGVANGQGYAYVTKNESFSEKDYIDFRRIFLLK